MRNRQLLFTAVLALAALILATGAANAQTGTMFVKNNKVGIGADNPTKILHLKSSAGGGAGFRMEEAGAGVFNSDWFFQSTAVGAFQISNADGGGGVIYMDPGQQASLFVLRGNKIGINQFVPVATLDVNGTIASRSTIIHPDYVFEPDYSLESIEDHAAYMWENKHLPAVGAGQYDDEGRAVIDFTARSQAVLEELEKAHVYIATMNGQLTELRAQVEELKAAQTQ